MSSSFAERFNRQARPQLWREHGETVLYLDEDGDDIHDLQVIWERIDPKAEDDEGIGADSFYATADAVVKIADLPEPHGRAEIVRKEERWSIQRIELQDEWTWILHLAHPRSDLRLPESLR